MAHVDPDALRVGLGQRGQVSSVPPHGKESDTRFPDSVAGSSPSRYDRLR